MAFGRRRGFRGNKSIMKGGDLYAGNTNPKRDNYRSLGTTAWRHDFSESNPDIGAPAALLGLDYFACTLYRFKRSFSATPDTPPTPSSGNNFQNTDIFNGSHIAEHKALIRLTNKSTTDPATLTVYKVCWSFYDAYVQALLTGTQPLDMNVSSPYQGEVYWNSVTPGAMSENTILNSKFHQHFYEKIGEITLSQEGSGKETIELEFSGVPSKTKRSQTGMFYGLIFANDSDKNEGRTLSLDYSKLNHIIEVPSENRLPWLA